MESRRIWFPLPPPLLESIATYLLFFHVIAHRGGRTDRWTDRPTQSSIEVLFAPKNCYRRLLLMGGEQHFDFATLAFLAARTNLLLKKVGLDEIIPLEILT
jgi:hypothetical protein